MTTTLVLFLLFFFMFTTSGTTDGLRIYTLNTTSIFSQGSWPVSIGSVNGSTVGRQMCFPNSWKHFLKLRIIRLPNNKCSPVSILQCYCLTSDFKLNEVVNASVQHNIYFGKCFYGCFEYYPIKLEDNFDTGNPQCAKFNRTGVLCGQCKDGYGPAVYSFNMACVECGNITLWSHISLYVVIAYGPLTVFLGVIVVFSVSANSASLHGWILVCQLLSTSTLLRTFYAVGDLPSDPHFSLVVKILGSIYGIWNLDFFAWYTHHFVFNPV